MEVEGKEEEGESYGGGNYLGANWNAWRDWFEWNTYALTRDSRFGFLCRAEWMFEADVVDDGYAWLGYFF